MSYRLFKSRIAALWLATEIGAIVIPNICFPTERSAAFALYQAAPQNPLYQSAHKLQAHRLPRRHRRAGRGDVLSVGKTTCRKGRCD